jgi:DNA invertase Pin-like site-specific DNA recombinase
MPTLIAYLRSLNNGQSDDVVDVERQRHAMQAWASKRRHRIEVFIRDDSPSPSPEQRPGLVEAIAALHEGHADGLVVYRLACLDDDVVTQEQLLAEVRSTAKKVYSLAPDEMTNLGRISLEPPRQLVRHVLQEAAKNEDSIRALRAASRNGMRPAGAPPYGFRVEGGELVSEPSEQATVARISELQAAGASLRQIVRLLDAEGHNAKRAGQWHPETVRRILSRLAP